jgi:hypothetical protein
MDAASGPAAVKEAAMANFRLFPRSRRTIRSTVADHDRRPAGLRIGKRLPDRYWLGLSCVIAGLAIIGANELCRCWNKR